MAGKESKTPLYDKHKKVHDLVGKLHKLPQEDYHRDLEKVIHDTAHNYLNKNAGDKSFIDWSEKGDDEHRKFTDSLWDKAADHIASKYLKLSKDEVANFKKKKTADGHSMWEHMISRYMGGMDKDAFFDRVKDENELTIHSIIETYVGQIAQRHMQYRSSAIIQDTLKQPEDMDTVHSYMKHAKKHNKTAMRTVKVNKFKSIDEAANSLASAIRYIPRNYHPDKADTYGK